MDVNGTHFQLLLGYDDWAKCSDHTTAKDEQGQGLPISVALLPKPPVSDSSQQAWTLLGYGDATTCPEGQTRLLQQWKLEPAKVKRASVEWDDVRQEISLASKLFLFTNPNAQPTPLTFEQRRGTSSDRYGNWYWIDETKSELRVNSAGTDIASHFWSADDLVNTPPATKGTFQAAKQPQPPPSYSLSGLAVTEHHYLVVGMIQPQPGLLIFDLHSGGAPRQLLWPPDVPFAPFDITAMPGGGVCILDRTNKRYWRLDRQFNIVKEIPGTPSPDQKDAFQPKDNSLPPRLTIASYTRPIAISDAVALPLDNPVAIEALPDCSILILDSKQNNKFSDIYRYLDGQQSSVTSLAIIMNVLEDKTGFTLIGYDFSFVPEHNAIDGTIEIPDLLFVVSTSGEQAFAFHPYLENGALQLKPTTQYFPMRLFGGKGLATFCEQVYYDFASPPASWLPLTMQARRRYEKEAIIYTPIVDLSGAKLPLPGSAFDGHVPDCVWHRLLLDACIPPETSIRIKSRAANRQDELSRATWQDEPPLSLRRDGSELPYLPQPTAKDRGTWELLFQNARGRYLQLRLDIQGNERSTPRISALRAYYPRFSYLEHYLPATYREDRASASFLDRYLANLEGFYTSIEDRIAAIQVLCDAYSAPPEVLDWLAGWFGVLLAPGWEEQRKRLFIQHAMDFFQYRGTIRGLQMALRLVLDSCVDERIFTDLPSSTSHIRIIEKYKTRTSPGILFGDTTDVSGVRLVSPQERWTPTQGGTVLNHLYIQEAQPPQEIVSFPIADPGGTASTAWQQFSQRRLGFVPSITTANPTSWHNFLARRYQTIKAYNDAYLTNTASFEDITLPTQLPRDGKPLVDWYQFESVVLSMHNTAHRFVVLLPVLQSETANIEKYQQRYELARRILIQEKPTQTQFDIRFYWNAFRVAEARLGEDTFLDTSSRVPPLILGQNYIGESMLTANYPQNIPDRQIVSRDALSR